jgi:hypothetical protein
MALSVLPSGYALTRDELQRVAVHVLARRRAQVSGRFGLRAMPGGFGTPAFGPEHETIRISGTMLIRERTGSNSGTTSLDLQSATLGEAAALAEVDLAESFDAGSDTPPVGDAGTRLVIDLDAATVLENWYAFAWNVLDATIRDAEADATPSVIQLWPEHFDAAYDRSVGSDRRVNLGASPGDSFIVQPYIYVGPWSDERPGDPVFWNTPFGATLTYDELRRETDPRSVATRFLLRGVEMLRG